MKLKIIKPNKSPKTQEISYFENFNDLKLPKDYKNFLLKYNGGIPERNRYDLFDGYGKPYWIEIEYFYSLDELNFHRDCNICSDYNPEFLFIGLLNIFNMKGGVEFKLVMDLNEDFKIKVLLLLRCRNLKLRAKKISNEVNRKNK